MNKLAILCVLFVDIVGGNVINITQSSGLLTTPNYPQSYPANSSIRWIITTPDPTQFLQLQIIQFNVEGYPLPSPCSAYDYLLLVPGPSIPLLGGVCNSGNTIKAHTQIFCNGQISSSLPLNIPVSSNSMAIEFCSDSLIQLKGVDFGWSTISTIPTPQPTTTPAAPTTPKPYTNCVGVFNLAVGGGTIITSPNYPNAPYPNNALCTWTVNSASGEISVATGSFDVEGYTSQCFFDYLRISVAGMNDTYCGQSGPNVHILASSMTITFVSDAQIARLGFQIFVSAPLPPPTPAPPVDSQCGKNFTLTDPTSYVTLYSPGWPNQYSINKACMWRINNQLYSQNKIFQLTFQFFDTEPFYDTLVVYPSYGNTITFEGKIKNGTTSMVDSSGIFLRFFSDYSVTRGGFVITVSLVDRPFSCALGQFRCGNTTTCIPIAQRCDGTAQCPNSVDETSLWCKMGGICGTQAITPNIYIPPSLDSIKESDAGVGSIFIVNGTIAKPGSWPWTVGFYFSYDGSINQFCGGSLIAPHWVVTAAHCVVDMDSFDLEVHVGSFNLNSNDAPFEYDIPVEKLFYHPLYKASTHSHDIALLKLSQDVPFPFNTHINSVCLPNTTANVASGTFCVATGWGTTDGTGSNSALRQVVLPIIPPEECNSTAEYSGSIDATMVCAGYTDGGRDTCQGDSGGPLVCRNSAGRWVLTGVTSFGEGCALPNRPGVYARVSSMLPFIYQTMADND